jgi:(E)-4-hydroxy-3-methylbut-2-enyl-diphosphate synthase
LLEDGIGDTVRVSLTEDPELEIPVAKSLIERYNTRAGHAPIREIIQLPYTPYDYKRRQTTEIVNIGGSNVPRVIADFSEKQTIKPATFFGVGYNYSISMDKWNLGDQACDYVFVGDNTVDFQIPGTLGLIYNSSTWDALKDTTRCYPLYTSATFLSSKNKSGDLNFLKITTQELFEQQVIEKLLKEIGVTKTVLVFETSNQHGMAEQRRMFMELLHKNCNTPVIIKRNYSGISEEHFQLYASTDLGALLLDGFGDGIWIKQQQCTSTKITNSTAFGILQATRTRISKTEYISCPSCGRTLFDLQETTARIRTRTDHLKGVKIGIMGCIVNGPGEMADADYGYVGTGIGKITLYKGREVVERNINSEKAVDALIELIKKHGDWVEKEIH